MAHFDPLFGPPVCIGREVGTGAGPLDLLYVSPSGYLTVVETKPWKSSEARRQVVAQIIDYTRRIVRWDYSHLEEAFLEYARQFGVAQRGLIPYVADHSDEDLDEMAFTDAINRNLRLGRLLLLIVGDGIREGVEEMTAYLQDAPNLQFTLGLVEIGCYGVAAGPGAPSTSRLSQQGWVAHRHLHRPVALDIVFDHLKTQLDVERGRVSALENRVLELEAASAAARLVTHDD